MIKSKRRQPLLFVAISWLVARLWWGLEASRLSLLRVRPKAIINPYKHDSSGLPVSMWVHQNKRLTCLSMTTDNQIIIAETPAIELN